jgi:hypothetical protein
MKLTHVSPILNVSDVPASIAWFEKLGWQRCFSWNQDGMIIGAADLNEHGPAHFAGIANGEVQLFLCKERPRLARHAARLRGHRPQSRPH